MAGVVSGCNCVDIHKRVLLFVVDFLCSFHKFLLCWWLAWLVRIYVLDTALTAYCRCTATTTCRASRDFSYFHILIGCSTPPPTHTYTHRQTPTYEKLSIHGKVLVSIHKVFLLELPPRSCHVLLPHWPWLCHDPELIAIPTSSWCKVGPMHGQWSPPCTRSPVASNEPPPPHGSRNSGMTVRWWDAAGVLLADYTWLLTVIPHLCANRRCRDFQGKKPLFSWRDVRKLTADLPFVSKGSFWSHLVGSGECWMWTRIPISVGVHCCWEKATPMTPNLLGLLNIRRRSHRFWG